jgi:hypothetical protein
MTLFEVVLQLTYDDPFIGISRRFPSSKIFSWCNREHDVVEIIVENPEEYSLVMEQIPEINGVIEQSSDRSKVHLIIHKCSCMVEDSMIKHIGTLDLLHVYPVICEKGWEYHRIIAFRHEDLEELLQRLEKAGWAFKILRKVPFDGFIGSSLTLTADALFSHLTQKQMDALLTAYRNGYYKLPRKADVKTIASKERVPRTTFQEHLKKAENKLVVALVPYIQLFNHAPQEKKQSLKIPNIRK